MKNLFTNLMKNTAKSSQDTGGGASQSQTSRSEGARQITARFESAQMKNTSLISGCSAVDVPMPSYGAPDEHPMSTRSASDERRWNSRVWKYVACMLMVLVFGIGQMWGDTAYGFENNNTSQSGYPTSAGDGSRTISSAIKRTGSYSLEQNNNNTSAKTAKIQSLPATFKGGQHYVHYIAYVCKNTTNTVTLNYTCFNSGNDFAKVTQNTALSYDWTRITGSGQRTGNTQSYTSTEFRVNTQTVTKGDKIYIDDIVVYVTENNDKTDLKKPGSATSASATTSSISWTSGTDESDASNGVTGIQATLIFHRTGGSVGGNDLTLNDQGIYSLTATEGPSVVGNWTLLSASVAADATSYSGTFTAGHEYAIVHRDLAYNYSTPTYVTVPAAAAKAYTVTAESNNDSWGTASADASSLDASETTSITATPNTGYKFVSWAVSGTGAMLSSTTDNPTTLTMGTANATVTASFRALETYTISYAAGTGGSGSRSNDTKTEDEAFTLPNTAVFTRSGYVQSGWTTSDGGSQTHAFGGSYTTNAAQTFYPVWSPTYTVTYNTGTAESGSAPSDAVSYVEGASVTLKDNTGTLAKSGYVFCGWNTSSTLDGDFFAPTSTFEMGSGNVNLYPVFGQKVTWNVQVNTAGTSLVTSSTTTSKSAELAAPTDLATELEVTSGIPSGVTTATNKIATTKSKDGYISATFTVQSGYKFTPLRMDLATTAVSEAKTVEVNVGSASDTWEQPASASGAPTSHVYMFADSEQYTGTVTMKIYVYGGSSGTKGFRLGTPIVVYGIVEEVAGAGPSVSSFSPADGATVKTGATVTIAGSDGSTVYYQWSSSSSAPEAATIVSNGTAGTSGAGTVTTTGISSSATYLYAVAVKDAVNSDVASASYTIDDTAPTLSSSTPANGATGVTASGNIVLTFSESIADVDDSKFSLSGATIGTVAIDGSDDTKVNVAYTADPSTTVTLTTDAGAVQDAAGNTSAALSSISFTTAAVPVLTALTAGTLYQAADMADIAFTGSDQYFDGLSTNMRFYTYGTTASSNSAKGKTITSTDVTDDLSTKSFTSHAFIEGSDVTSGTGDPTYGAIEFITPSVAGKLYIYTIDGSSSNLKLRKKGTSTFTALNSSSYYNAIAVDASSNYYIHGNSGKRGIYGVKFVPDATVYSVSADPVSGNVCSGNTATITLSGSQSGVSYQLYKGESAQGDAKAGTGYALSWTGIDAAGTYTVKSVANASYNATAMSGSVTISILAATAISTQPTEPIVVTLGDAAEIAITATGEGVLTYEWYTCNSDGTGATKIEATGDLSFSGFTTATLGLTPDAGGSTYYKCTVTGTCGSATTNVIEVQAAEQYDITHTLSNIIKVSGEAKATAGGNYTAVYRRTVGYTLPATVTVTRGETNITALCTWNSSTGTLTIPSAQITGDITITVTGTAVDCPDASSTETLFLYEPKTSLSDADIPAGTYTFYDAAPGDYLNSVSGGFVTLSVPSAGNIRIRGKELAFNSGSSYVKIELDCELQAKDRITVTSSGNTNDLWISLDGSRPSQETDATAVITQGTPYRIPVGSDLIGESVIYFWRSSSSTTQIGQVQIVRPETAYDITTSATNGTITTQVSGAAVVDAVKDAQVDISATGSTGYQFSSWSIYKTDDAGTTVTPNAATASTYFTMPQYDVTVSATFSLIDYTVTHSAATNGSYTIKVGNDSPVSINTTANYGQTVTLGASPADGYAFSSWTVTGATSGDNIEVDGNNQFVMPAEAVTISASFAKLYTVSAGSHTNGSITLTPSEAVAGTTISIAATGDLSYVFSSWTIVDGESTDLTSTLLGANSETASTSFTMPAYDVTVSAAFEVDNTDYTVSFSAGTGGGTVPESESGKIGSSFTVPGVGSMTAPTSKLFKGWLSGDDVFYPSGTTYTITGNATLTAVWDGNGSSVTLSWFDSSQNSSSGSPKKPDTLGKYFFGYSNSAKTSGYAYTITTANTNNKGQGTGDSDYLRFDNGSTYYIYADNTTTSGTPASFSGVTSVSLKIKLSKDAGTSATIDIKVGSTTIADNVNLSEASTSSFKLYEYDAESLNGIIQIIHNTSGDSKYNLFIDDITITCGTPSSGKTVTFDNQTGFNGTTTLPDDIEGIPSGSKILRPETDPSASGYTFGGWYKEAACTNAWDFATDEVDDDITLYAKWEPILLTAVSIGNLDLNVGFSGTPAVTKTPVDALASAVWSIVDGDSYISIDSETGEVTATAPGTAHVKVVMTNSNSAEITSNNATVTVTYASLSSITISPAEVSMPEETSTTLTATFNTGVDPSTAVTWESSDSNVASVTSEGVVTAYKEGTATITASSGLISGTRIVTVENVSSTGETVTFTLGPINSADASLDTASTASSVPAILINRSNIDYTRVGLASSPSKAGDRTAKVITPENKDNDTYVLLTFDVASGYTFNPTNVAIKAANVSDTTAFDFELADNNYSVTSTLQYLKKTDGTVETLNMANSDESKKMTGTVSLKIWPYRYSTNNTNTAEAFRFGNQIVITGNVQAAYADAIYEDGAWKYGRMPNENRAVQITENITITTGTTYTAKSVELDENVQMTVEAGAALVVEGQITVNGSAPTASNLILGSDAEHGNGTLIFNNSNHAAATVQMYSKAEAPKVGTWKWQYAAAPAAVNALYNYYGGYLYKWNDGWNSISGSDNMELFAGYCVSYPTAGHIFAIEGELAATGSVDLTIPAGKEWVVGNSWTAPIQIKQMETTDFVNVTPTIYLFNTGMDNAAESTAGAENALDRYAASTYVTIPIDEAGTGTLPSVISSLQGFYVANSTGLAGTLKLDYAKHVRPNGGNSVVNGPMHAPERSMSEKKEVLTITADGSRYSSNVMLIAHEDYTFGYDPGHDGENINEAGVGPLIYTLREDGTHDDVSAIPEYEGAVVGFVAGEDSEYTFRFTYDGADIWYLNDTKLGQSTLISNENTYTFTVTGDDATRFVISKTSYNAPSVTTGVGNQVPSTKARKLMIDGILYIIREGRIYTAEGALVK